MKKYTSNAEWEKIPRSTDYHDTREQASAVCITLLQDYGSPNSCETRGQCMSAWVEEMEDE